MAPSVHALSSSKMVASLGPHLQMMLHLGKLMNDCTITLNSAAVATLSLIQKDERHGKVYSLVVVKRLKLSFSSIYCTICLDIQMRPAVDFFCSCSSHCVHCVPNPIAFRLFDIRFPTCSRSCGG